MKCPFGPFFACLVIFQLFTVHISAQFRNGPSHTGVYPDAAIHNSAEIKWKFPTNGAIRSTPAVTEHGIIFGSTDGNLYSLSSEGKLLWKFTADASVSSSPVVSGTTVYCTSRKNTLYAVSAEKGTLLWKRSLGKPLDYEWGFDYYTASVFVEKDRIYVGSADGQLYALKRKSGEDVWKFTAHNIIRSTPAIAGDRLYFGDVSGKLYAVSKDNGTLQWIFRTIGDTLVNTDFGFDRKAIIASPVVINGTVYVGSRDGFLYAVDAHNGKERWRVDYQVSWVISTAAVKNGLLVTGTSDGRFVHALDTATGKERWRFLTQATVWASAFISGNDRVVIPSNDGYLYCLELMSGKEVWRQKIGAQIFSSPVPKGDNIYFGSDDGFLYCVKTFESASRIERSAQRAVFWMKDPLFQLFRSGMDIAVRDYFIKEGYEFYDETDIKDLMLRRIRSADTASVIVFATNYFLPSLTKDTLGSTIIKEYLKSGGRMVMLGMNPAAYQLDSSGKQITGINFLQAKEQTGIPYHFKDLRSHGGFYSAFITPEGKKRGLVSNGTSVCGLPKEDVTIVLAADENDRAAAWVKTFSGRVNSGYIQLFLSPDRLHLLPEIQKVAEYGL